MGVHGKNPVAASGASRTRAPTLSAYLVGFVAVFVLAAGTGLGALFAAGQLSEGLLVLTLAGLGVFAAASVMFYRAIPGPIASLSTAVREMMAGPSAGPLAESGPPEVASLARAINELVTQVRAGSEKASTLAAIVESSEHAIIGKTLDGIVTSWNPGAEKLYGYRAEEVIGRSVTTVFPPGHIGDLAPILDKLRRGEAAEFETRRRRKDGTIVDVSVSVTPVCDTTGIVTAAAAVARNITERVRLETERRAMERHLHQSERLESLGQLAGGIAHDFNNLLAIIMNYAGFVTEEAAGNSAVQADVKQIQDAADRAARITRQLLIVGGRDAPQPELLDPAAIVGDVRELLATALGAGIELRVAAGDGLPAIRADRGQVEQVLLNLAVNARDAMPEGGTLTVMTRAVELTERPAWLRPGISPGRYAELTVTDTGCGMNPDTSARIFDPFFTTKPVGRGTGLGLATVRSVVTRLGGDITVDSKEGGGTTFRVLLPAATTTGAASVTPAVGTGRGKGQGQTVLVVDDELPVLQLTARILRQNGYAAMEAGTCQEALSLAASRDPQLLVTDSVMPHMSGSTLADRITAMKPAIRVLYMSGHSGELLSQPTGPGREFIQKPFSPQDLLDKVHSILESR
jgi:two-component system cell cycle sensor histidine kinase/response regulator CckA